MPLWAANRLEFSTDKLHYSGLRPNPKVLTTTDFAEEFKRRAQILIDSTKEKRRAVLFEIQRRL